MGRRAEGDTPRRPEDRRPDEVRVREEEPVAREERPEVRQQQHAEAVVPLDSVRWGPVWAGLVTTVAVFVLLELLAFSVGILGTIAESPGEGGFSAWVTGIIGLIAFFTGGSVAGMTSVIRGPLTGIVNGIVVWALATTLIILASALGLGNLFGALGNIISQLLVLSQLNLGGGQLPQGVSPQQFLDTIRGVAFGAFVSVIVAAAVSAVGGFLGGQSAKPIGHTPQSSDWRG